MTNAIITEPTFYHREYSNDIGPELKNAKWIDQTTIEQGQRITGIALPVLTIYKPLQLPASIALGALRVITSIYQLADSIKTDDNVTSQCFHTTLSVAALAATIFIHPVGMLITTAQDLLLDTSRLVELLKAGEYTKALEISADILNNGLYLAFFLHGGLGLGVAALSMQILNEVHHVNADIRQGNHLAALEHATKALVRSFQLTQQLQMLETKKKVETLRHQIQPHFDISHKTDMSKKMVLLAKSLTGKDPYTGAGDLTVGGKTGILGICFIAIGIILVPINPILGGALINTGTGTLAGGITLHNF